MTLFSERPIRPMLAKPGEPFSSKDYVFEPKWDGLRTLVFKIGNMIELQNRNLRDVTASFPELQEVSKNVRVKTAILDGEAVVLGTSGTPDFGRLQTRFGVDDPKRADVLGKTTPVTFVAFDLLHVNGEDIIATALQERKRQLKSILREGPHLLYGEHVENEGKRFFKEASKKGFEGIIAKRRDSPYRPGLRGDDWVKIKGVKTVDGVIIGYTQGEGSRGPTFGSLVLAAYNDKGRLQHLGNVGGGFDNALLEAMRNRLSKIERKTAVIMGPIDVPSPITWVSPLLVCEVKYTGMTAGQKLRFPRFSRLRTDKAPKDCRMSS